MNVDKRLEFINSEMYALHYARLLGPRTNRPKQCAHRKANLRHSREAGTKKDGNHPGSNSATTGCPGTGRSIV